MLAPCRIVSELLPVGDKMELGEEPGGRRGDVGRAEVANGLGEGGGRANFLKERKRWGWMRRAGAGGRVRRASVECDAPEETAIL